MSFFIMAIHHNVFAPFHDMKRLRDCLRDLRRGQLWRPGMDIRVQSERKGHEELPLTFTHARAGLFQGMLIGGAVGFASGLVITLIESSSRGFQPIFAFLFCVLGTILGLFAAALVGPMNPDKKIGAMEKEGNAILAVESEDPSDVDWATQVMLRHGAVPQEKRVVPTTGPRPVHRHA